MKALIVPACTDLNRGDQSLVWETHRICREVDALSEIAVVDYGENETDKAQQSRQTAERGIRVVANIVDHPRRYLAGRSSKAHDSKLAVGIMSIVALVDFFRLAVLFVLPLRAVFRFLFRNARYIESFDYFMESEVVVVKGGGFVHTYGKPSDLYYLFFTLYYVILGLRVGKRVVFMPNSYGPLKGPLARQFVRALLNRCDLVYCREDVSFEFLQSIGVKNAKRCIDLGYFTKAKKSERTVKVLDALLANRVAVTVRPYRFPSSADPLGEYENYIQSISTLCDWLIARAYHVCLVVQVQGPSAHEDDRIAVRDVVAKLKSESGWSIIDDSFDCEELSDIYAGMKFLVGTRFHSVIFAQNGGVPSLAIGYGGNKSFGIMKNLGLGDFVVPIEGLNSQDLKRRFERLEERSEAYVQAIKNYKEIASLERARIVADLKDVGSIK